MKLKKLFLEFENATSFHYSMQQQQKEAKARSNKKKKTMIIKEEWKSKEQQKSFFSRNYDSGCVNSSFYKKIIAFQIIMVF